MREYTIDHTTHNTEKLENSLSITYAEFMVATKAPADYTTSSERRGMYGAWRARSIQIHHYPSGEVGVQVLDKTGKRKYIAKI